VKITRFFKWGGLEPRNKYRKNLFCKINFME
jgi:hypothetical protein